MWEWYVYIGITSLSTSGNCFCTDVEAYHRQGDKTRGPTRETCDILQAR